MGGCRFENDPQIFQKGDCLLYLCLVHVSLRWLSGECVPALSYDADADVALFRHQIGINGNVIANPGFIETFGNQVDPTTGAKILSAATLSAFSAMISTGQIIGMLTLPL